MSVDKLSGTLGRDSSLIIFRLHEESSCGHLYYTDSVERWRDTMKFRNQSVFISLFLYKEPLVLTHVSKLYTCAHLMSPSKEIFFVKMIDLNHNRNAVSWKN